MSEAEKFKEYCKSSLIKQEPHKHHNLQANVNIFNSECDVNLEDFGSFPWISTYPSILELTPGIDTPTQEDNVQRLVDQKQRLFALIFKLGRNHRYVKKNSKFFKDKKSKNPKQYMIHVAAMAELLQSDPDKFFEGSHNWYFTGGGAFDVVEHEDHGMMYFSACGPALSDLRVTRQNTEKGNEISSETFSSLNKTEIYQISATSVEDDVCIVIRQKMKIIILRMKDLHDPSLWKIIESSVPFVSTFIEEESADFLFTLDVNENVQKWDVRGTPFECSSQNLTHVTKFRQTKKRSNWGIIQSINNKYLVYADEQRIKVLHKVHLNTQMAFNLEEFFQVCSGICCIAVSKFSNLLYIATTHNCHAVSFSLAEKESRVEIRWTHRLCSAPTFMRTCLVDEKTELIAICSTYPGDMRILFNEREVVPPNDEYSKKKCIYKSPYLPYKMKNMSELYYLTRLKGKCLDPTIPLQKRIHFHTSGMDIVTTSTGFSIFTVNSIGDVYHQELGAKESTIQANTSTLTNLSKEIRPTDKSKRYHITGRHDLKNLERVFRSRQFNHVTGVEDENVALRRRPKWRRSIKQLKTYTDILAQNLLDIWEMDDEEEQENKILTNPNSVLSISAIDKVGDWLQKNHGEQIEESTPEQESLVKMKDEDYGDTMITSNQNLEVFLKAFPTPPTQNHPSPRTSTQKKAKKKSRVIGF